MPANARILILVTIVAAAGALFAAWLLVPGGGGASAVTTVGRVTIYSTTDSRAFAPVIADFRNVHPDVEVDYLEIEARPLYERFLEEESQGLAAADLLLSSSMDLQSKLVNDGYASRHTSRHAPALPAWARWRDEAIGFTYEPAVMVFNSQLDLDGTLPRSRAELLDTLRRNPDFWRSRVGTYDIARSGVGYLLASQDDRQYSDYRLLMEAFGDAGVRLEENTSTLLSLIEQGELAMGYNLLGSYALARVDAGADLTIVYPSDYTLVVSRTAVIPRSAPNGAAARAFVDYLLSPRGQHVLALEGGLSAIREDMTGPYSRLGMAEAQIGLLRPILLGPGLLTYLDQQKQQKLLATWQSLVIRPDTTAEAD